MMKPSDLQEVTANSLAWGETDGAVSINADAVAARLNELLLCVQQLEADLERHRKNWGHISADPLPPAEPGAM